MSVKRIRLELSRNTVAEARNLLPDADLYAFQMLLYEERSDI